MGRRRKKGWRWSNESGKVSSFECKLDFVEFLDRDTRMCIFQFLSVMEYSRERGSESKFKFETATFVFHSHCKAIGNF